MRLALWKKDVYKVRDGQCVTADNPFTIRVNLRFFFVFPLFPYIHRGKVSFLDSRSSFCIVTWLAEDAKRCISPIAVDQRKGEQEME